MRLPTWVRRGDLIVRRETGQVEGRRRYIVSADPPCRERKGRIKIPGLAEAVWRRVLERHNGQ